MDQNKNKLQDQLYSSMIQTIILNLVVVVTPVQIILAIIVRKHVESRIVHSLIMMCNVVLQSYLIDLQWNMFIEPFDEPETYQSYVLSMIISSNLFQLIGMNINFIAVVGDKNSGKQIFCKQLITTLQANHSKVQVMHWGKLAHTLLNPGSQLYNQISDRQGKDYIINKIGNINTIRLKKKGSNDQTLNSKVRLLVNYMMITEGLLKQFLHGKKQIVLHVPQYSESQLLRMFTYRVVQLHNFEDKRKLKFHRDEDVNVIQYEKFAETHHKYTQIGILTNKDFVINTSHQDYQDNISTTAIELVSRLYLC